MPETPLADAVDAYINGGVAAFTTPGHHRAPGLVELDCLGAVHAAEVGTAVLQRELDLPLRQLRPALLTALAHRLERVLLEVHGVSVKRLTQRMSD